MSWDVVFLNGTVSRRDLESDTDSSPPLGSADGVRTALNEQLRGIDWTDPNWGVWKSRHLSFEFNLGGSPDVGDLSVHVRGSGDPFPTLLKLASANAWAILDMSTCELLDLDAPSRAGWEEFVGFRSQLVAAAAGANPLELTASGLTIAGETLVRRLGTKVISEYALADITGLTFAKGVNLAGVTLAAAPVTATVAAKLFVPIGWLSWALTIIFGLAALVFSAAAFAEYAAFEVAGKSVRLWLAGPPVEIVAFRSALRESVERAQGRA